MRTKDKYARVICEDCGPQFLTEANYDRQMDSPNRGWKCPQCGCYPCVWDDEYFEEGDDE